MQALGVTRTNYGLLAAKERALYIVRDHIDDWFQSMADYDKTREMEARAKARNSAKR